MTLHSRDALRPRFALETLPSKKQRAQGRPGARCTRGLVCKCAQRNAHEHTGTGGASRPSLRSGFTAYSVLSPVNGSFATVAAWISRSIRRIDALPRDLTPAPRRQDHTTSPYASRPLVLHAHRVHRIPPRVRDDREPPLLSGETGRIKSLICPTARAEYFCAKRWTGFALICPSG